MSGPTVVGYVDRLYAYPGDEVTLRISTLAPPHRYRAQLVRLICGETGPKGPGHKEEAVAIAEFAGEHQGKEQPTGIGSCIVVDGLPALGSIELSVHVWPTLPGRGVQCLLSLGDVRLVLNEAGAVAFHVGDQVVSTGRPLRARWWHRVEARYDASSGAMSLDVAPAAGFHDDRRQSASGKARAGIAAQGPLLMAAAPGGKNHFYGKLEAPVLRSGVIEARWDFSRRIDTTIVEDLSPAALHGRTVNAPKRAVTGALWDGTAHHAQLNPSHYAAIHFHGDDLSDAHWEPSLRFRLPEKMRSGFYAVKLQGASGPAFYVGVIVSPRPGAKRARLAVQASTVTYLAYANYRRRMSPGPFELTMGALPTVDITDVMLAEHPEFGSSTYDVHRDGFGVGHATARRPLFNFRPTGRFWNFSMDLCLIDWLDQQGLEYDVISDHELQDRPDLLKEYRCVLSGSHPEYYTLEMLRSTESFLAAGGRFMYLGGNGFYWRVTFPPAHPDMIELRRAEDGTRAWAEHPGQYHHSTGELGGLWRRIGRPPNALVGIGFIAQGFDNSSYYRRSPASRDPRAAFLFAGIDDEILGDFGAWGDGAAGLEIDCYDERLGSPPHALIVASSENHSNAFLLVNEEMLSNSHGVDGTLNPRIKADIVFFETEGGGAMLSTGSISFVASLAHDDYRNNISRLIRNAVDRFIDPAPFKVPGA